MGLTKAFRKSRFSRGLNRVRPQELLHKSESAPTVNTHQPVESSTNIIPSSNDQLSHFKKQGYSRSILKNTSPRDEEPRVVNVPKVQQQRWPRLSNYRNSVVRAIRSSWNKIAGKKTTHPPRNSIRMVFHSDKEIYIMTKKKPSCVKGTCRELIERKRNKDRIVKRFNLFSEALGIRDMDRFRQ